MLHRAHTPHPQQNGRGFLPITETEYVKRTSLIPRSHFWLGNEGREKYKSAYIGPILLLKPWRI